MTKEVKKFSELSPGELYEILSLRSAVFVVEQQCIYQDPDGKDDMALHVLGYEEDELLAYTRIFPPGAYFQEASIGRVAVSKNARSMGLGKELMQFSITVVYEQFGRELISLSAQSYLKKFYRDLGFVEAGEEYLEDGIPHIRMVLK